jgi:hypothetical protein
MAGSNRINDKDRCVVLQKSRVAEKQHRKWHIRGLQPGDLGLNKRFLVKGCHKLKAWFTQVTLQPMSFCHFWNLFKCSLNQSFQMCLLIH